MQQLFWLRLEPGTIQAGGRATAGPLFFKGLPKPVLGSGF